MLNSKSSILACAVALAGLVSCEKKEQVVDNPNYNKETNEVTTSFVFNVATGNSPTTKQSSTDTQAKTSEIFRGMEKAFIIPYTLSADGKNVAVESSVATKVYDLDRVLSAGEITSENSRRVLELALPNGTNAMMFYAKAQKDGTDAAEGKVDYNVDMNPANTAFKLSRRLSADRESAYNQETAVLTFIQDYIVRSSLNVNVVFGSENFSGTRSWKYFADKKKAGVDVSPLGEILADAFTSYTTIQSGELRAGSGKALASTNGDLWSAINHVANATPTSLNEAVAKAVASEITTRLAKFFTEAGVNCKWKDMSSVISSLSGIGGAPATDLILTNDINAFPKDFLLSEGAAQLAYVDNTPSGAEAGDVSAISFSYNVTMNLTHLASGITVLKNHMFPPELMYFGNSPLRVSGTEHVTNDYPQGVTNWDNNAVWTSDWVADSHVISSTRSVAMKNNINYGTALLETTVRYGAATLKDNKKFKTNNAEEDNEIPAGAGAFILKGLIIGGQPHQVGWDFTRKYKTASAATAAGQTGAEKFDCVIYDTEIPNTAIPAYVSGAEKSDPNYTLVFDNWDSDLDNAQSDVYVALEFENRTGTDFWGMHNLVRNGGTFYIVGKLKCADGGAITWPTKYALPPYETDGSTIQNKRVFIQDYVTKVDFVLGEDSLKKAYLTVPDLRSSHISLGLSVDIQWQTGLTFNNVILGGY